MKVLCAAAILTVVTAAANPYVASIINEVGRYPDSTAWIELHASPFHDGLDLTGWRVVTSTSACTLDCQLAGGEFLVIDSAMLADGWYGRGTFRLDSVCDSVRVITDGQTYPDDVMQYVRHGPDEPGTPVPSIAASSAVWNEDGYMGQSISCYPDSTPTPGGENDDWSSFEGSVTVQPGETLLYAGVDATGVHGSGYSCEWDGRFYTIKGLAAGTYQLTCYADLRGGGHYQSVYPESVHVAYGRGVRDINFVFPPVGIVERLSRLPARRAALTFGRRPEGCDLYDVEGRRVANPGSGIYFVRPKDGFPDTGLAGKAIIVR